MPHLTEHQFQLLDILCMNVGSQQQQQKQPDQPENDEKVFFKSLVFIFLNDSRKLLEDSVEIAEGSSGDFPIVRMFRSKSSARSFSRVRGSRPGVEYFCLDKFCSCPNFIQQAKATRGSVICKHLLAIKIGRALHKIEEKVLSDDKFVEYLCQESSYGN